MAALRAAAPRKTAVRAARALGNTREAPSGRSSARIAIVRSVSSAIDRGEARRGPRAAASASAHAARIIETRGRSGISRSESARALGPRGPGAGGTRRRERSRAERRAAWASRTRPPRGCRRPAPCRRGPRTGWRRRRPRRDPGRGGAAAGRPLLLLPHAGRDVMTLCSPAGDFRDPGPAARAHRFPAALGLPAPPADPGGVRRPAPRRGARRSGTSRPGSSPAFDGRRWDLPSRIYSDLYVLRPGEAVSVAELQAKLARLFYQQTDGGPGAAGALPHRQGRDRDPHAAVPLSRATTSPGCGSA